MNQRLVWNFEFSKKKSLQLISEEDQGKSELKWEARFFWPDTQIIILANIDDSLLDIARYEQKHKEDDYYLLPDCDYNIKRRRNNLLYKPVREKTKLALGYSAKINLDDLQSTELADIIQLKEMARRAREDATVIHVKKESFTYKFSSTPSIKLELARLEVLNKTYFSVCVEGRSLYLVETISEHLLRKQISCDYVTFLKNISNND